MGKVSSELLHRWSVCQGCGADRSIFRSHSECRRHHDGIRQVTDLQIAVTSALGHVYFSLSGFSQKIPLSLLPGCLNAGAIQGAPNIIPWWDMRHRKELESAIRHQARTGEAEFHPRIVPGDFITNPRIPWLGDVGEMAERMLQKRFIEPAQSAYVPAVDPLGGFDGQSLWDGLGALGAAIVSYSCL